MPTRASIVHQENTAGSLAHPQKKNPVLNVSGAATTPSKDRPTQFIARIVNEGFGPLSPIEVLLAMAVQSANTWTR